MATKYRFLISSIALFACMALRAQSCLPNGIYFLQVVSEGKVLAAEKFVKQ